MNYSKDYKNIRVIIDEIIGVDTQQGGNLKMAIKKYFELKPPNVKLVSDNRVTYTKETICKVMKPDPEMDNAMTKYTEKIKSGIADLKKKKKHIGIYT